MSEENVNLVRNIYAAFGKGDIPAVLGGLDPQIEWWEAENFIYAEKNPYVGQNEILEGVFMRLGEEWDGFAVSPKAFHDAGETVVAEGYYSGTYKKTGKPVRSQFAHLFTFRDGRVVKFQQYTDTAQFAKAVKA